MRATAAEVDGQFGSDFTVCGIGVLVEQSFCGNDHTGCAEPALGRLFFEEGALDWMQVLDGAEAFEGNDLGFLDRFDRQFAGWDGLSVYKDLARAALFQATAKLCAFEAQDVDQGRLGIGLHGVVDPVDMEGNFLGHVFSSIEVFGPFGFWC